MTHSPCRPSANHLWRWRRSRASPTYDSTPLVVMFRLLDAVLGLGDCSSDSGRGRGETGPVGCVDCGRWWKCSGLGVLDRPRMLGRRLLCRYTRGVLFHPVSLYHRARHLVCLRWRNSSRRWALCLRWRSASRRLLLGHGPLLLIPPRALCLVTLRVHRGCTSLINRGVSGRRRGWTGGVSGLVQAPIVRS